MANDLMVPTSHAWPIRIRREDFEQNMVTLRCGKPGCGEPIGHVFDRDKVDLYIYICAGMVDRHRTVAGMVDRHRTDCHA